MFNRFAPYTLNGIPHQAPPGFRDEDFAYVFSPVPGTGGGSSASLSVTDELTNGVMFTAVTPGSAGNSITINIVNPGGTSALSVTVVGNAITISVQTLTGTNISTNAAVVAAVAGTPSAAALVTATVIGSGAATVPNTPGPENLFGGAGGTTAVLGASGSGSEQQTITQLLHSDSIFIWTGLEFPPWAFVGVRIRYGQEYLSSDYLYAGAPNGGSIPGNLIAPFPIFPPRALPPACQMTIDFLNKDTVNAQVNYQLVLRGYKRIPSASLGGTS